uniref:Uncharacterized protein n=1 Tax=Gossypium raimondii TaxID=29730 RepID=A0A0D2RNP6_GOSRA|nr:hypothetical protein B456_011G170200 [Gossypium raimondii]
MSPHGTSGSRHINQFPQDTQTDGYVTARNPYVATQVNISFSNTPVPVIDIPPIQRRLETPYPFLIFVSFFYPHRFLLFFYRYCRSVLISSTFITNPQHCLHRRPISATSDECCSVQLIDGDGSFNGTGIESFIKEVKLHECGLSYAVVSIMGPQSNVATPKQMRELMQVDGLTNDEVKSHSFMSRCLVSVHYFGLKLLVVGICQWKQPCFCSCIPFFH